jgi:transcription elongation factor GreA
MRTAKITLKGEEMQRVPITKEGLERLKSELQRLQREERPANIKAIEEARAHGDISENAEFEAAKERQAHIEGRMQDLSQKIGHSEVVGPPEDGAERVLFGCTVVVEDMETNEVNTYKLVGPYEADVQDGTISVTSPLGKALIGKEEGEEVRVQTPKGIRNVEILEIKSGT